MEETGAVCTARYATSSGGVRMFSSHDCWTRTQTRREKSDKRYGFIVVPLVVPENMDFETFAQTTAFQRVAQTITALSTQDERIAEEFRAIEKGRISSGKIVEIEGDVPVWMKMNLGDFAEAISTRIWESVGRANWRSFPDARAFMRGVGLQSNAEWRIWCNSEKHPPDIPDNPDAVYATSGWVSWGDFLGTDRIAAALRQYRPFTKARAFVRTLGLKNQADGAIISGLAKRLMIFQVLRTVRTSEKAG